MTERKYKTQPLVLIADLSEGLRAWLTSHLAKTFPGCRFAEAASEADIQAVCAALSPDVVLLDVSLAGRGLELVARVNRSMPTAAVILLSTFDKTVVRRASEHVVLAGIVGKTLIHEELVPLLGKLLTMAPEPRVQQS